MPKFPDPTKEYAGEPVQKPAAAPVVGAAPLPEPPPLYEAPPPKIEETPQTEPAPNPLPTTPVSSSPFRNLMPLIIGAAILILLAVVGSAIYSRFAKNNAPVTLTYWGLWEPISVMQAVIADYEAQHPNVKITYSMQSPKNYRTRLQSAITSGNGPDIARIHNTWLPMLQKSLSPAPDSVVPTSVMSSYYPVVQKNAVFGGKVYALPLEIDGLALFYNEDMLKEANASPPSDWNTLRKLAFDLTKTNAETKIIERAGAAIGTTGNVEHWSDILGLLILQNSGDPSKPTATAVQDALTFFTIFSTQDKSWDASQPNSVYAFATGTVAMILAPSWQVAEIKAINPNLKFGVAPAPTLPSTNIAWASYWMEAVPLSSKNATAAWEFIKYLSSEPALQKMYAGATQIHTIGEPYPLTSMKSLLTSDPLAGAFVNQGPAYTSWPLVDRTYDEGVNDEMIKYYEDAVNAINDGSTIGSVIKTLDEGVQQVVTKYPPL
jgi:multiple sugar transport system substrate-binding protein